MYGLGVLSSPKVVKPSTSRDSGSSWISPRHRPFGHQRLRTLPRKVGERSAMYHMGSGRWVCCCCKAAGRCQLGSVYRMVLWLPFLIAGSMVGRGGEFTPARPSVVFWAGDRRTLDAAPPTVMAADDTCDEAIG